MTIFISEYFDYKGAKNNVSVNKLRHIIITTSLGTLKVKSKNISPFLDSCSAWRTRRINTKKSIGNFTKKRSTKMYVRLRCGGNIWTSWYVWYIWCAWYRRYVTFAFNELSYPCCRSMGQPRLFLDSGQRRVYIRKMPIY